MKDFALEVQKSRCVNKMMMELARKIAKIYIPKLWDVQTGTQLYTFTFDSPARSVDFFVGDKLAVISTDPFMGLTSAIHVKRISRDPIERNLYFTHFTAINIYFHLCYIISARYIEDVSTFEIPKNNNGAS